MRSFIGFLMVLGLVGSTPSTASADWGLRAGLLVTPAVSGSSAIPILFVTPSSPV